MLMRTRSLTVLALAVCTAGVLTACGDNSSTAESDGTASSSPTVVVPANPTTSGKVETTTPSPHSNTGESIGDGAITEVSDLPSASAVRSASDDAFLAQLADEGIDVSDQILQDQVIAAAHEQCTANEEGRDSFSVPAVAGQLQALGVTDKDPETTAAAIKTAAEDNYCS
ncbi:DUF732 domain-containing protein [Corynebacterium terpenotabidum]|uniref:DUF732 domain-containing protein n=1 Tax=Corynebacterium terpenotabidum Y-11 TaxID=1200352 RepID=S4XB74_9CORY|nr:DUF732 domain-containing protein [Corynebacterium terpenotabidum]AGP29856.1 hypothetical protein A606_01005 [Corynebacterium terpenotabidum Y-11]